MTFLCSCKPLPKLFSCIACSSFHVMEGSRTLLQMTFCSFYWGRPIETCIEPFLIWTLPFTPAPSAPKIDYTMKHLKCTYELGRKSVVTLGSWSKNFPFEFSDNSYCKDHNVICGNKIPLFSTIVVI